MLHFNAIKRNTKLVFQYELTHLFSPPVRSEASLMFCASTSKQQSTRNVTSILQRKRKQEKEKYVGKEEYTVYLKIFIVHVFFPKDV